MSWAHPGWWITTSTSHFPKYAAQVVPSSSLLTPPPSAASPSHHDATFPWQARGYLPEGDFTIPITLTTAQIKPCHLNHKQQSNRAGELKQSNRKGKQGGGRGGLGGRERDRTHWCHKQWKQSHTHGLGRCRETVQLEGGVRRQNWVRVQHFRLLGMPPWERYPLSSCFLICRMEFITEPNS